MQLRNPCKKCIVRAACKRGCGALKDMYNTRYFFMGRTIDALLAVAIGTAFYHFITNITKGTF